MALLEWLSASGRPVGPLVHGPPKGVLMPVVHKQRNPPLAMPDLQELVNVGHTGLMFGAASTAAATCSAWRSFKRQQCRRRLNRVAVAQQMSDTSLPNRRCLWDHPAGAVEKQHGKLFREQHTRGLQKKWRDLLQELQNQSAQTHVCRSKNLQRLNSYNSEHIAERELLRLIARQRVITQDYLNQVKEHISKRSCPLEQLHREIECAESRNAALLERLKEAEERKQRLDNTAQVLKANGDVFLREEPSTFHIMRSTHCSETLQEEIEVMEIEEECPRRSEEQRGSPHDSASMDHAYVGGFGPDLQERSVTTACLDNVWSYIRRPLPKCMQRMNSPLYPAYSQATCVEASQSRACKCT